MNVTLNKLKSSCAGFEMKGRMSPMSLKVAAQKHPGTSLRVVAQGILDKPDGGHRIIHDGTHGV